MKLITAILAMLFLMSCSNYGNDNAMNSDSSKTADSVQNDQNAPAPLDPLQNTVSGDTTIPKDTTTIIH